MEVPNHFVKLNKKAKDNKYLDTLKEEEVYCPKLGSFEIYVDDIQIFSKIKSNVWPKI